MEAHHELTLKQILDSAWVRRLGRLAMIVTPVLMSAGGLGIGWIVWDSRDIAKQANSTAASAVAVSLQVKQEQQAYTLLEQQRAQSEQTWRNRFDAGLTSVQADVGEIKGDVGELKGLIMRQTAGKTDRHGYIWPTYVFD